MRRWLCTIFAALSAFFAAREAYAAPALEATQLYTAIAKNCEAVDLTHWSHPTFGVLKKATAKVTRVELCNDRKYPIFTVEFKYDPRGQTDSYFYPLFQNVAKANGYWPFSFVDATDAVILNVGVDGKRRLRLDYEDYAPSGK
jgi:hypothetical protein